MMRSLTSACVMLAIASCVATAAVAAPDARLELGPIPTTGIAAWSSIEARSAAVIEATACGREFELWDETDNPDRDPYAALIAKVGYLGSRAGESCRAAVAYPTLDPANEAQPWGEPFAGGRWTEPLTPAQKAALLQQINGTFSVRYGASCGAAVVDLTAAGPQGEPPLMIFELTPACLRAQVETVLMTRDRNGANPGSSGLPCYVAGKPAKADWDMAVYQLTRLVYLARGDRELLTSEAARQKLDHLLTLSGALQGESYGLYQCGNPDNTTGSAQERADEAAFYDDGFFDDLGNILDWLLAFLAVLGAVIAIAVLAAGIPAVPLAAIAAGVLGTGVGLSLLFNSIRIEETENHLLMINSSKYLKNQLIISELQQEDDRETFRNYNRGIRSWLLRRLQRIVDEDFGEYNSRPYQRLSIGAILNIHDFADDAALRTAAAAVLDLAAAKMALGSSQGRRIVPFRRLAGTNAAFTYGADLARQEPQHLFEFGGGSDHMIAAMLLWSGQTQHMENRRATLGAGAQMVWEATSSYRPHPLILDIAIDKSRPYEQRLRHGGWEHYASGPGWLLTAGGTQSDFAQLALLSPPGIRFEPPLGTELGFLKNENRGAGVPTTLMPHSATMRQDRYRDFLRFEGLVRVWDKADPEDAQPISYDGNLCLDRGFACGLRLQIPPDIETNCLQAPPGTPANLFFIDSASCDPYAQAPRFFVVVYRQRCSLGYELCHGSYWGFIEVVDAADHASFEEFVTGTIERNGDRFAGMGRAADGNGISSVSYRSWRSGTILFDPDEPENDADATGILQIDGGPHPHFDLDDWGRADGDIITSQGRARFTIGRPNDSRRIVIDLSNYKDPRRDLPPP